SQPPASGPPLQEPGRAAVAGGGGVSLRLGDVATLQEAPAPRFGDALIQGRDGVLLSLSAAYGTNTVEVTRAVEAALADLAPLLARSDVTLHPRLHPPASFVGAALAFLQGPRAALVSLTAIPLSLLSALIVLSWLGLSLNTMSLGGLAIAIGEGVGEGVVRRE